MLDKICNELESMKAIEVIRGKRTFVAENFKPILDEIASRNITVFIGSYSLDHIERINDSLVSVLYT